MQDVFRDYLKFGGWIIAVGCIGLFSYFYLEYKQTHKIDLPITNCDLREGPCSAVLPNGEILQLKITPTNMPVLTSVMLEVRTPHALKIKNMHIRFKGKEMNMGEFHYVFQCQKEGIYTAQTVLPTCVHDQMIWEATLNIDAKREQLTVPFLLVNEKPKRAKSQA